MLEAFEGAKERAENNRALAKALEKRVGRAQSAAATVGVVFMAGAGLTQTPQKQKCKGMCAGCSFQHLCVKGKSRCRCQSCKAVVLVAGHQASSLQRLSLQSASAAAAQAVQSHANSKQGQCLRSSPQQLSRLCSHMPMASKGRCLWHGGS